MFYWRFHFDNEIQSIFYLLNGSEHIYWIWDLENEVYSIWDLWISGLQECKYNSFFEVRGAGNNFRSGLENLTVPEYSSPEKFVGGNLMSALVVSVRARCFVLVLGFSVSKCV